MGTAAALLGGDPCGVQVTALVDARRPRAIGYAKTLNKVERPNLQQDQSIDRTNR